MSMNDYNNEIEDEEFEDVDDSHQMQKFREMKSKNVLSHNPLALRAETIDAVAKSK